MNFTVTIIPAAPMITSLLTASGVAQASFSYQITASNGPATFTATGLPAGLTLSPSSYSGLISGVPTTAGTYDVTFGATNAGGTVTATLVITISAAPPVITALISSLANFDSTDGTGPNGSLITGYDGNLWGMAFVGGSSYDGTVFKITPTGTLSLVGSFNSTNGNEPYAGLTLGSDGNYYGTTLFGGSATEGNLFKMTPAGAITSLVTFIGSNGEYPVANLTRGND
jgi:uncharacterized repeat protein (TIGR03803 family)